jgi:hypothetical protein
VDTAPFVKGPDWWHRISDVNQKGHIATECGQTFEHVEAQAGSIDSVEQDNGCPKCVPEKAMKLATGGEIVRLQEPAQDEPKIGDPLTLKVEPGGAISEVSGGSLEQPVQTAATDELDAIDKMAPLAEIAAGLGITVKPGTSKAEVRNMIRAARAAAEA